MIYFIAHNLSLNRSYYLVLFFTDMCFAHLTIGWNRTHTLNGHLLFNGIYIYAGIFFSFQIAIEEHY